MSETRYRPRHAVAAIVVLAVFAIVYHVAHRQRQAFDAVQKEGSRVMRVALLPRMYAASHNGMWPPLDPKTRAFVLPMDWVPRGYTLHARLVPGITDPIPALLLANLNNAAAYTLEPVDSIAATYIYFGYAVTSDSEYRALVKAIHDGAPMDADISVGAGSGTLGSATLYRLSESLADTLVKDRVINEADPDASSRIPVLTERPHDGFAWVLYLDRSARRIAYPGEFPLTPAVMEPEKPRDPPS